MKSIIKICLGLVCIVFSIESFGHQGMFLSFKGKLKSDSVYVELIGHEGYWNMNYFYTESLEEFHLDGVYDSTLAAFVFSSERDSVKIYSKKDLWKFKWWQEEKKMKNKFDSVIAVIDEQSTYVKNRISRLNFTTTSENDSLVWLQENFSGVSFFRLNNNADSLNLLLERMHRNMALKSLDCHFEESDFHLKTTLFKVGEHYLSFHTQVTGKCVEEQTYFNCSVEKASKIHLEDLFYFSEGKAPNFQTQNWFNYRYKVFPKKLLPYLKVEDTCLNDATLWQFPTWYMVGDKIVFVPFSAFNKERCNMEVTRSVKLSDLQNN